MPGFTITKQVNAPVEEVFGAFSDVTTIADRIEDIKKVEVVTDGPVGAGTRFRETRVMFGRDCTEEMEFSRFEQNKEYTLTCNTCGCLYEMTHRFTPEGDGTKVEFELQTKAVTFFAKLMSPLGGLMMGSMKKCIEKDFDSMKAFVESRAKEEAQAKPETA